MSAEVDAPWVNATGDESFDGDPQIQARANQVGREIANWVSRTQDRNRPSLFNRAAYAAPTNPYSQMATARSAVDNDDVVGAVADVTEGLIFQGIKWESSDADDADLFNQIARDLNLDEFARQWYREDFTHSQAVIGLWWGRKAYKLRGKTEQGKRRKATKTVLAPVAWTFLDPQKVVPLKPGPFGQDRLAWHASTDEMAMANTGLIDDEVLREFTAGPANVRDKAERDELTKMGIDYRKLLLLNPNLVFRLCRTKMSYDRFADVRLKSVFPLLDLKQQLIEADRVSLVGAANYILLVRQGDKDKPATQPEIDNLQDNFRVVAKLPVVVGDHRLSIDIITPDQTNVLSGEKYDTLDKRILARTLGALATSGNGQRNEGTVTIGRGVSRALEARRHMMKRMLEDRVARAIVEHPANEGIFKDEPNLAFTPRNISLDSDAEVAQAILTLRTQKEISRETTLEHFGLDQSVEAQRRELEEEMFDDIFKTIVPFDGQGEGDGEEGGEPSQVSGARGGRPKGGGQSKQSVQGRTGKRSASGQPTPKS